MDENLAYEQRWRKRRLLFNWGMLAWFVLLGFWLGPLFLLWDVPPPPKSTADFVAEVNQYCVPVVRKMKEYERIHGHRPDDISKLGPEFQSTPSGRSMLTQGGYSYYSEKYADHLIQYDFTPGMEGWSVLGHSVKGIIPMPPVKLSPMTQPTTEP